MSYLIDQSEQYLGNDYWKWSAWIVADKSELARVDKVVWLLHPTFKQTRVTSTSRETKFRLDSAGWGTFPLRAELHLSDAGTLVIRRNLKLTYPASEGTLEAVSRGIEAAPSSAPESPTAPLRQKLFLSFASEDAREADALRLSLSNLGIDVVDASATPAGMPLNAGVRKLIRESDAVVAMFGSSYASPNVVDEIKIAQVDDKPTIALTRGSLSLPESLFPDLPVMDLGADAGASASLVSNYLDKLDLG